MEERYKNLFKKYLLKKKQFRAIYFGSDFEVFDVREDKLDIKFYEYDGKAYDVWLKHKGIDLMVRIDPLDIVIYLMDLIEEKE